MVCCKQPVHVFCLRSWFRENSANGAHPNCPHCKKTVNRILYPIRLPSILSLSQQSKLINGDMRHIIREMYTNYCTTIEEGLHNRLRSFTFRNIDSFFLQRGELPNAGHIFLGFENRFTNTVMDHLKTPDFQKQFVTAVLLQIPGWSIPITTEFVRNLFDLNSSTLVVELSHSMLASDFWYISLTFSSVTRKIHHHYTGCHILTSNCVPCTIFASYYEFCTSPGVCYDTFSDSEYSDSDYSSDEF